MKNELELAPAQPLAVRHSLTGINVEALLEKAIDAKSAVEVMERLQVMRREMRAEQAKEDFDLAMSDFQSGCPIIVKEKQGAKNAYRYAPLDAIVAQTRDLIRKHGFSFSITSKIEEGRVLAIVTITHATGHSRTSEFAVPVDTKNPMMTDPQRFGGAMTFAKRYAFCNGFGIMTADEDIDGAGSRPKPAGPSTLAAEPTVKTLATELWALLKPTVSKVENWNPKTWQGHNDWLWREELLDGAIPESAPDLSPKRFREVIDAAKAKL